MKQAHRINGFVMALLAARTCLHAAEPAELTTLRARRGERAAQIQQEAQAQLEHLNGQYIRALDSLMQNLTRAGQLDGALAVREERNRFLPQSGAEHTSAPQSQNATVPIAEPSTPPVHPPSVADRPSSLNFLSSENIGKFSFEPEASWATTNGTLVFTDKEPQIKAYATFEEVLPRKQAFSMKAIVNPRNIREIGFGFAGGFQMSTLFPQDGKSYELFLVVSGDRAAYWVEKKRQGSYYSWGGTLKLGVLGNDNTKTKKAVYSQLEFTELTVDEANKLLNKK